jgi:hypothetical protein
MAQYSFHCLPVKRGQKKSSADEISNRKNSRFEMSYILALPNELSVLENQRLLVRFFQKFFNRWP